MNAFNWHEGVYFTTFIVGMKYISVLHAYTDFTTVLEAVLDEAGEKKTPFAIVSSIYVLNNDQVIIDNELATITLGI